MGQTQTIGKTATTISRDQDGVLRVTYHSTNVVTVYPNGRIVLDTGGWQTATTKARMNQASNQFGLGFCVYQKAFQWYVDIDGHTIEWPSEQRGYGSYLVTLTIRNEEDKDEYTGCAACGGDLNIDIDIVNDDGSGIHRRCD